MHIPFDLIWKDNYVMSFNREKSGLLIDVLDVCFFIRSITSVCVCATLSYGDIAVLVNQPLITVAYP